MRKIREKRSPVYTESERWFYWFVFDGNLRYSLYRRKISPNPDQDEETAGDILGYYSAFKNKKTPLGSAVPSRGANPCPTRPKDLLLETPLWTRRARYDYYWKIPDTCLKKVFIPMWMFMESNKYNGIKVTVVYYIFLENHNMDSSTISTEMLNVKFTRCSNICHWLWMNFMTMKKILNLV